ncbi:XRE family transcriptional regulator [Streptomyces albidoflavus]|uniref:XRE family transcriptional regulator n=1 Tax=Streptomyces albidoflavus TaxID=1886 RepID=UPI0033EA03E5
MTRSQRQAIRELIAEMTALGCRREEVVAQLRHDFRMRPREAYRLAAGLTLDQSAAAVTEVTGGSQAPEGSGIAKAEKWPGPSSRRPSLSLLGALAQVYGCEAADLVDVADLREMPPADRRVLRAGAASPAAGKEEPQAAAPAPPAASAPAGVSNTAGDSGPALVRRAAEEAAAWAGWAEASNVGPVAVEQFLADTRARAEEYLAQDPAAVFLRTRALRDRVFGLLQGHQSPAQARDLYQCAGYLCALLAWMSSDLGHPREGETQARTGWLCAELADQPDLRAWVASTQSAIALWDGRLRDAIQHAARGSQYATTGTVATFLACQEADAWSLLGAAGETRQALERAADAQERARGADPVGGLFRCGEFRTANYRASALLRTGDAAGARDTAQAALDTYSTLSYGTTAQTRITLAAAHLACRDTEAVRSALDPVLALPPDQRLAPLVERIRDLGRDLATRSGAGAPGVQLRTAIADWCADSAPRRLPLSP